MDKRICFAFVMVWFIVMVIVADNGANAGCNMSINRKRWSSRCKKDERTRKITEFKEKLRNLQNARYLFPRQLSAFSISDTKSWSM